jgi:hypothetical protein
LTRIRELRAAGKSLRRIAAELTAAGTPISHELVRRALAAG